MKFTLTTQNIYSNDGQVIGTYAVKSSEVSR